jgi:hypothetical protein
MNYIKRLEADNLELRAQLEAVRAELQGFRVHLASAKFVGLESDGGRRDWIATGDVHARLAAIEDVTREGGRS